MKSTQSLINEGKAQWNKMKTEMEELNVQLSLGRTEAKELFDREWKKFAVYLEEQTHRLRRQTYWADHLMAELDQRARNLKTAMKQAAPINEKLFNTWRESTLRIVYELEFIIDELYPVLEPMEKELLSSFRIKMEVYRTRLLLLQLEELDSLKLQTAQLIDKADDVLLWRSRDAESSQEKMQQFSKDISLSFDHMKKAFGGLLKQ